MSLKFDSLDTDLTEKQKDSVFHLTVLSDFTRHPKKLESKVDISSGDEKQSKIQLSVEFYNWLDSVEKALDNVDEEAESNDIILDMKTKKTLCDEIHVEIEKCLDKLNQLKTLYFSTSNKTNALHEACQHLLNDQNQHIEKAKAIEESLRYFIAVDNLTMKISFPNLKLTVENLEPILDQIDNCYRFLSTKISYRESANYLAKVTDSLWKILSRISTHFIEEVNKTFSQFSLKTEISQEKSFTMLYGKFRSQAVKLRPFVELISCRKSVCDLYGQSLEECEKHFIGNREQLLNRIIRCSIEDLSSRFPKDHCAFVRSGGSLMIRMCDDESNLYNQFFVNSDCRMLKEMLTRLCTILYDEFRPSIIHINHLETLAELCCILKVELVENFSGKSESSDSPIDRMCQMILADVQERLVFRTHIYIKSQILGYSPSAGDLAYPEKLEMMISIAESMKYDTADHLNGAIGEMSKENIGEKSPSFKSIRGDIIVNPGPNMSLSPADLHGMWYPTVRRTLVCLSKLHRCLDLITFQGLAQDCVAQCVQSLIIAGSLIEKQKTITDSQLFLIKHLLILREQVAPFNVEFTVKETSLGFSNIKNAAVGLISSRSQLLALNRSNSLIRFLLETPDVIETVVDSRHQLDGQLKLTCDKFINNSLLLLVGPLNEFLQKVYTIETMSAESNVSVKVTDQPFAELGKIQELLSRSYRELSMNGKFGEIRKNLHLYLSNSDTEMILLKPIKNGVLKTYRLFNQFLIKYFSEEDCHIISCPSEKQVSLQMEVNI